MIVSVHVPKCAGTSFRTVLDSIFGDRIWHNYGTIFSRVQARPGIVPSNARIIHGHFIADSFDHLFPGRRLVTWVRHPVERVVSNYHHFLRSPDMRDDCCRLLHERKLGLCEFADLDWMKNMATRYLANKPIEEFSFVGVAEYFQESMQVFCRDLGIRTAPDFARENLNPERKGDRYPLTACDYAFILERNQRDLAWYEEARGRLTSARLIGRDKVA